MQAERKKGKDKEKRNHASSSLGVFFKVTKYVRRFIALRTLHTESFSTKINIYGIF